MWYPCGVHVICMWCACGTRVMCMECCSVSCVCWWHFLFLSHLWMQIRKKINCCACGMDMMVTYVVGMWYPCDVHVIRMWCACDTHVMCMEYCSVSCVCWWHFLFLPHLWIYAGKGNTNLCFVYIWYPCGVHVIAMWCACDSHVVCMWPRGYSNLCWVRMSGPKFQPLPFKIQNRCKFATSMFKPFVFWRVFF